MAIVDGVEHLSEATGTATKGNVPKPARAENIDLAVDPWSPQGMLVMQQTVGNQAVGRTLAQSRRTTVQRADPPQTPPNPYAPYVAHPAVLADCISLLHRVYATQSAQTLAVLRGWKTIAIGAVVDPDRPNVTKYHWTAAGNWNDSAIAAAMAGLGVRRWDADASRQPRGTRLRPGGAPGDAEQRLMSGDDTLKALAVSRPPCFDCASALADYGNEYGRVLVTVVPPPTQREQGGRENAINAIRATAQRVRQQLELYEGEHKAQAALINEPSFSGFAGFWTNRLFNREVPAPTIWINAYSYLSAVNSALARGGVREATINLIRARRQLLVAIRNYATWKDGIEAAGTKAQVAIGAIAIATIVAVVVGPAIIEWVIEAASEGAAEAGAEATEEQLVTRIATNIARTDEAMLAWEAQVTEAEIEAEALEEANQFYATLGR